MWDILKNDLDSSGTDEGYTQLGRKAETSKNLLWHPRIISDDSAYWTVESGITSACDQTGYDGVSNLAWQFYDATDTKYVYQEIDTKDSSKALVFSFYLGKQTNADVPTLSLYSFIDPSKSFADLFGVAAPNYTGTLNKATGAWTETNNTLGATAASTTYSSTFFRNTLVIPTITLSRYTYFFIKPFGSAASPLVLDGLQLEYNTAVTDFEDQELYYYNKRLSRACVCKLCGFPVEYKDELTSSGRCTKCIDKK